MITINGQPFESGTITLTSKHPGNTPEPKMSTLTGLRYRWCAEHMPGYEWHPQRCMNCRSLALAGFTGMPF